MKKSEIVIISATGLVFMLTSLMLRDILPVRNFLLTGVIGGFAALLALWWGFKFLKGKSVKSQIVLTAVYCSVMLAIGFFFVRGKSNSEDIRRDLIGTWFSPASDKEKINVKFVFVDSDSLIVEVDNEVSRYSFNVKNRNELTMFDSQGVERHNWIIKKVDKSRLIIGKGDEVINFKRIK